MAMKHGPIYLPRIPKLEQLLWLLSFTAILFHEPTTAQELCKKTCEIGQKCSDTLKPNQHCVYQFNHSPLGNLLKETNLRLKVGTNATSPNFVCITVLQPRAESASFMFQPYIAEDLKKTPYTFYVERTICLLNAAPEDPLPITVILSSESKQDVWYTFEIEEKRDFMLEWNVTKSFDISHNTPHFFRFQFPEKSSFVRILADADSEKEVCMTFSAQSLSCPIFDEPESVNYEGIYQTISSSGALIVKKQDSFQEEFIVVLVVHPNNDKCMRWNPFSLPNDNLVQTRSNKDASSLKSTSLFVSILVKAEEELSLGPISKLFYWMLPSLIAIGIVVAAYVALTFRHKWIRQTPISRPAQPTEKERVKRGLLTNNYIKNLHVSKFTNGKEFIYVAGIVALFYVIPTVQFAAYYFRVGTSTGNLDLCYYNFRCAQPIWYFLDFNHLFSNLPYMIFGLLFCLIVKVHESKLNGILELHQANNQIELGPIVHQTQDGVEAIELGIPPNFGMFKTLAIALFLEGVLSASYHLCPYQATFQFDTCFMYVIAVLSTVLIYQQRHPRWFNSNHTFGTLGCMLFLTFVGLLLEAVVTSENRSIYMFTLGTCFWLFQLGVTLLVCFNYIFVGVLDERQRPVNDGNIFRYVWRRDTWKMKNLHSHRLVYPTISILITLTLGFVWYFCQLTISDYLLYLLIAKLICSMTYYFIMKVVHDEFAQTSSTFPLVYFQLSGAFVGVALFYHMQAAAEWGISPAESRAKNRACVDLFWIGEYPYDSHDLWHFLSAAALFLAFNGLLILDDDLVATPWTDISVS